MRFDVEDARREIADIGRGLSGQVRIGIVPTAAQFLLPRVAKQLLQDAPAVTLKTTVGLVDTLKPLLQGGELDLIVATESPKHESGLVSRLLAEDCIVVVASARHPLLKGKPTMRDLTGYRWVLQPPGAPTRDWLDHAFDRKHLPRPDVQIESSMLIMLPPLIAETGLLSFVSRHHVGQRHGGVALQEVPLKETTMRRRLTVTHRENSYLSPAARKVIALLEG